jgi:hypothetical protein
MMGWLVNDELEGIWKEKAVINFKILPPHLLGSA